MMRLVYAWMLCVGVGLLRGAAGASYPLSPFDNVKIDDLQGNDTTLLVVPSFDGTYSLNASMQGLIYTIDPATHTLELSQVALELNPVSSLLDDVFQYEHNEGEQQQGEQLVSSSSLPSRDVSFNWQACEERCTVAAVQPQVAMVQQGNWVRQCMHSKCP